MIEWRLKKGSDRRFRSGHPWVYSNELQASPKGIEPGQDIRLTGPGGEFLAYGHGNPSSLISFRELSRDPDFGPDHETFWRKKFERAYQVRRETSSDLAGSFRLCFAESDGLSGLVIDRFSTGQVYLYVVQLHSAGMDRNREVIASMLLTLTREQKLGSVLPAVVVLRRDLSHRTLEGLKEDPAEVKADPAAAAFLKDMTKVQVRIGGTLYPIDPIKGQKTGFFLDQRSNIDDFFRTLAPFLKARPQGEMLDLCCFLGQWTVEAAKQAKNWNFTLVDRSEEALGSAVQVMSGVVKAAQIKTRRLDVLNELDQIADKSMDLVVCDPPAFIQKKKDVPQGAHAYLKLFENSMRKLKPGGAIVLCSCSGLFEEAHFAETVEKAARRAGRSFRWVRTGSQAVDHPVHLAFPEGHYLKAILGIATD